MRIDIDALIAAKRKEREERIQKIEENERERRERRIQRAQEQQEIDEREIRKYAAEISDYFTKEYCPRLLHSWFRLDNWTVQEGLILLCGFDAKYVSTNEQGKLNVPLFFDEDPWSEGTFGQAENRIVMARIRRLDGLPLYGRHTFQILGPRRVGSISAEFSFCYSELLRIWKSGTHTEHRYPPKYFIEWALSKRIEIEWLEWASAQGYYGDTLSKGAATVPSENGSKEVSPKSESALLNIIGALCELYWEAAHDGKEYSQSVLLDELKKYEGFPGMSERNLKDKLTKAMRAMKS